MSRPTDHHAVLRRLGAVVAVGYACVAIACGSAARPDVAAGPAPAAPSVAGPETPPLALAGVAALPVLVLPTYRIAVSPKLGWTAAIGAPLDAARSLDDEIRAAVQGRGVQTWTFSDGLEHDYSRNRTYATDPYTLAEEFLRAPSLKDGDRLPEPLASQLRTMVALRDNARLVLAPVDLRIEPAAAGGQGTMRLVLIDARSSDIRWIGAVRSDAMPMYGPAFMASLGARVADLVAAP
jgi:hypothetical protein